MRPALALLIGLVLLTANGCASHRLAGSDVQPFEGEVQLQYPPSSGHIDATVAVGNYRYRAATQKYSLDYTVRPQGDVLHWRFTALGKVYGIDHNKRAEPKTLDDVLKLYKLTDSHDKLTVEIETDRLGNLLGEDLAMAASPTPTDGELNDAYWQARYRKVFSMLVLPFSTSRAVAGTVVSHGHLMMPMKYATHFKDTEIALTGQKTLQGRECLVLEYKGTSEQYKNKYRQKAVDTVDAALILDRETKVLRKAKSVYKTKNAIYFLEATYSDPLPDATAEAGAQ